MAIEIKTEKVWYNNTHCRKILGIKALAYDELPRAYISIHEPSCAMDDKGRLNITLNRPVWGVSGVFKLKAGQVIPQKEFAKLVKNIKAAGNRLMRLKKAIWSGYQTVRI